MTNKPVSADAVLFRLFHAGWNCFKASLDSRNAKGLRLIEDTATVEAKRHLAEAIERIIGTPLPDKVVEELPDGVRTVEISPSNTLMAEQRKRLAEWLGEKG